MAKAVKTPSPPIVDPAILLTWRALDAGIISCTEEQLWELLALEKADKARRLWLQRIYGRASTLRGKREAKELLHLAKDFDVA